MSSMSSKDVKIYFDNVNENDPKIIESTTPHTTPRIATHSIFHDNKHNKYIHVSDNQ